MSVILYLLAKMLEKTGMTPKEHKPNNPDYRTPSAPKEWEGGKYVKDRPDYVPYTPVSEVPRDTSARTTVSRSGGALPKGTFGTTTPFNTTLRRRI